MNNLFKKLLAVAMCFVMLFSFVGISANAATYENPVFSVTVISENNTNVQVSLNLVSGRFNCLDFSFKAVNGYELVGIKRGDALVTYDNACLDNFIEASLGVSNVDNGSVSVACSSLYGNQGSFYVANYKKSSTANSKNGDFNVKFTNCSVLENGRTISLTPTTQYDTLLALGTNNLDLNFKDGTMITYQTNASPENTIKWTSSDNGVATVDEVGYVYAAGKGNATITCEVVSPAGAVLASATCEVTVNYTVVQWLIIILLFGFIWYI